MDNVFTIREGVCTTNWGAYAELREKLSTVLKSSMQASLSELSVDTNAMSRDMMDKLIPSREAGGERRSEEMCRALLNGNRVQRSGVTADSREEDSGFDPQRAREKGFFSASSRVKLTGCNREPDQYYFNGDHDCRKISGIIKGKALPGAMYLLPYDHNKALNALEDNDNQHIFSKEFEVPDIDGAIAPIRCTGPRGENAIYSFPYESTFWDLRYIVGSKTVRDNGESPFSFVRWFQLPHCIADRHDGQKLSETKLLFDFGSRIFVPLEVEVDGAHVAESLVLSYIAAFPENSVVRSLFMEKAPGHFFTGEMDKMAFIVSLAKREAKK